MWRERKRFRPKWLTARQRFRAAISAAQLEFDL
jgi:hypothetical protein